MLTKNKISRYTIILFFAWFSSSVPAQKFQKLIRSNSPKLSIRDGNELKQDYWTISPETSLDVFETVVNGKTKKITFITDIDSISFIVKPGKSYPFIILFNKDSAHTQINAVAAAAAFTQSQVSWLRKNTTMLNSFTATAEHATASYADLESFDKITGNAQIVALGESTHGSSEFFSMKHRLLEYAVVKKGFRIFALEDNQLQVEIINDYVLHGHGDIDKIMYGMFTVWVKQEVKDMIKWVRQYNVDHPDDPVEFTGFDMQNPKLAMDNLLSYLAQRDPVSFAEVEILLADFKKNWANDLTKPDSVKKAWVNNTIKVWQLIKAKKEAWFTVIKNKAEIAAMEWAVQNANVIKQCALNKYLTGHGNILYRDSAMAENISWILAQRPADTKMIVWAHDVHISRGDDPVALYNFYGGISMGSWLSKRYGNKYKAFGLETFSGSYTAYPSYTDYTKLMDCPLEPAPVGSLDKELHAIAEENKSIGLILDMTGTSIKHGSGSWLLKPLLVRFANHVCITGQYALKQSIPYQFDGIIFIDKTSGAKPIQ